jgi:hypothetical protein
MGVKVTPMTPIFATDDGSPPSTAKLSKMIGAAAKRILGRKFCPTDARRTLSSAMAEQMPDQLDLLAEPLGTSARILRHNYGSTGLRRAQVSATLKAKSCIDAATSHSQAVSTAKSDKNQLKSTDRKLRRASKRQKPLRFRKSLGE